ncbi:hypothetical protein GOBAR_AA09166 [Gossypium barbadense]|uniref:Uncharacterized protein n=1 Tax=Gossypium barbadense TaxID=3634 RepID=A0A2P5Y7A1_GOSBA|nr:hypothetical protein GOBAR_AA09166 [Gossypium barbadense]
MLALLYISNQQPEFQMGFRSPTRDPDRSHQTIEREVNRKRIAREVREPSSQSELADPACTNQRRAAVLVHVYSKSSQKRDRVFYRQLKAKHVSNKPEAHTKSQSQEQRGSPLLYISNQQPEFQMGFRSPTRDPDRSHQTIEREVNRKRIAREVREPSSQSELADPACTNQRRAAVLVHVYSKSSQKRDRVFYRQLKAKHVSNKPEAHTKSQSQEQRGSRALQEAQDKTRV